MKNKAPEIEFTEDYLRKLFDMCGGCRSHYLILTDEDENTTTALVEQGWVTPLTNSTKRPWFAASTQLIEKFRELSILETKQLQAVQEEQKENAILAFAIQPEGKAKKTTKEKPVVDDMEAIPVGTIFGPNGVRYENAAAAAKAESVPQIVIINRCKSTKNTDWICYS